MTELKVEREKCMQEEVVLNEEVRRRMTKNIKHHKSLLQKLAEL